MEGADAVAHGCTGKGNDQVRFELTFKHVDPSLRVIVPWREWELKGRKDEIEYAMERNIPVTATLEKIYSHDRNLQVLESVRRDEHLVVRDRDPGLAQLLRERLQPLEHG